MEITTAVCFTGTNRNLNLNLSLNSNPNHKQFQMPNQNTEDNSLVVMLNHGEHDRGAKGAMEPNNIPRLPLAIAPKPRFGPQYRRPKTIPWKDNNITN